MDRHRSGWVWGALLALVGCSDGTGLSAPVARVDVLPPTGQVEVGASLHLTATPRDSSGAALSGRPVTWASGAPARAIVDSTGLVTGVSPGSVTITASAEGVSGSASLTVIPGPPTQLVFTAQPASTGAGTTLAPIEVTARDAQGNTATSFRGSVSLGLAAGPAGATLSGITSVAATAGVATFAGVSIAQSGTGYRLSAAAGGLAPDTSTGFTIAPGPAARTAFVVEPSNVVAGAPITPAVQIAVEDAYGNLVASFSGDVTVAIGTNPVGGKLTGTATRAVVNGVASFPDLAIDRVGTGYTLQAVSGSLIAGTSTSFTVTVGTASQLAITIPPPSSAQSGAAFAQDPVIQVEDSSGNAVSQSGVLITASVESGPGGATLSNSTATTTGSGTATFSGLALTGSIGTYTLRFSTGTFSPAISGTITLGAGQGTQLGIAMPSSSTAQNGTAFLQQPVVQILDASGNAVSQSGTLVTAMIASGPAGASLSNATATTDASGAASFSGLSISGSTGSYALSFEAPGLTPDTSGPITLSAGTAASLAITTEPSGSASSGEALAQQPAVRLLDASGNPVSTSGTPITAEIAGGPTGGSLTNATANTTNGVATYSGLALTGTAGSYRLRFTSGSLTPDTSVTITLSAGAATRLVITTEPSGSANSGQAFAQQPAVRLEDASGNPVSASGVPITAEIASGPSGGSLTNATANTTNGLATFSGLTLTGTAGSYRLRFTSGSLSPDTSVTITLSAGAATQLVITTEPSSSANSGQAFARQPAVRLEDASGNPVSTSGVPITAEIASGPGGGSLTNATANTTNGVATFSGLALTGTAGSYRLRFTSGSLTPDTSTTITLSAGTATQLVITTEPSSTANSGQAFARQPAVQLEDVSGNPVSTSGTPIAAEIASGPSGGSLTNATANTTNGLATFSGLALTGTIGSYRLRFTSGSLKPDTSITITLSAGTPKQLAFGQQPTSTTGGTAISPAVTVRILDSLGNLTTSNASVSLAITPGTGTGGAHLSGGSSVSRNASSGVATFNSLSIDSAGTSYTLTATSSGLSQATSNGFDIAVGGVDAGKSSLTISTDTIGQCLNPCDPVKNGASTVTVQARDLGGNAVPGVMVTLAASPASTDSNRFTNPGPGGSTDGSGVFTANFNSAQALVNKTISATVGGIQLTQTRTLHVMPVLVGAGDISDCARASDDSTARLLDSIPGTVFADGDDVYPSGTTADFTLCYEPNWGRHKARTVPVLGNHEYDSSSVAAGYFAYYGTAADPLGNGIGYYSFDISTWHVVVLNSEPAGTASGQLTWLQNDLAGTSRKCILALWHEPLFTSGPSGGAPQTRRLWNALQNVGADLVINGHDHMYERFALQDSLGNADPNGIREIIAGTGGGETHANFGAIVANDEANDMNNYSRGVLRLTLYADSYRWEFIPASGFGTYTDSGTGTCH